VQPESTTNRRAKRQRCKTKRRHARWLAVQTNPARVQRRSLATYRQRLIELSPAEFADAHEAAAAQGDDCTVFVQAMRRR
jgi:hypothetical protein